MKKFSNSNSGFTIFVAVIVAGILTIIALSIANLSTREIALANLNRESGRAIFAANAGIECAMYWDSRPSVSRFDGSVTETISCGGNSGINVTRVASGGDVTSTFGFDLNNGADPMDICIEVTVDKNADDTTDIYSRGYNTCDTSNPRRVERGVEVHY